MVVSWIKSVADSSIKLVGSTSRHRVVLLGELYSVIRRRTGLPWTVRVSSRLRSDLHRGFEACARCFAEPAEPKELTHGQQCVAFDHSL